MRIVVANNFFPPRVGGSAHLSDSLARGYAARGHNVLVVTAAYGGAPEEETRDGVRIVRLPSWMLPESRVNVSFDLSFASRPSLPRRLIRLLDAFQPDAIHQHGQFMDLTWATGLYARRRDIPTLLSIHTRLENPAALYRNIFKTLDRTMVWPMMRTHRPRLVVMDSYMHDYITERYPKAYRDLVAIPVGVDPTWTRGGDAAVGRALVGVDDDVPLIASIGHVIPLRDRLMLIEALPEVLRQHPETRVAIAGRVYYDEFQHRAEELGVAHALHCLGPVPKSDIPHLLAAATVECHEQGLGLGTATLEAMSSGTPVVAWGRIDNFPGIAMIDGVDIFMTTPGDVPGLAERLCIALDDAEATQIVGENAQRIVDEHFALDRVVDRHLEMLADLVAHGPAHHTP